MSHLPNPPYPFAAIQVPPLLQGPLKVKARDEGGRGGDRPTDASGADGMLSADIELLLKYELEF